MEDTMKIFTETFGSDFAYIICKGWIRRRPDKDLIDKFCSHLDVTGADPMLHGTTPALINFISHDNRTRSVMDFIHYFSENAKNTSEEEFMELLTPKSLFEDFGNGDKICPRCGRVVHPRRNMKAQAMKHIKDIQADSQKLYPPFLCRDNTIISKSFDVLLNELEKCDDIIVEENKIEEETDDIETITKDYIDISMPEVIIHGRFNPYMIRSIEIVLALIKYFDSTIKTEEPKKLVLVEGESTCGDAQGARNAKYQSLFKFRGKPSNM